MTRSSASAPTPATPVRRRSYESVAWAYDGIARLYSRGRIGQAKAWQAPLIESQERVLYVGIGSGKDAVLAAQRGARVTGIDLSRAMLRRAAARFERAGLPVELIGCDLFEHVPNERYDVVVLNFFLSVFDRADVERAVAHALGLLTPGGRIFLADFAPLPASRRRRFWPALYYWPVDWAGALLGLAALHAPHDNAAVLARQGCKIVERAPFPLIPGGSPIYEALVAVVSLAED